MDAAGPASVETGDLPATCKRMRVSASALFVDRAAPEGELRPVLGPAPRGVEQESRDAFPGTRPALVRRGGGPAGDGTAR